MGLKFYNCHIYLRNQSLLLSFLQRLHMQTVTSHAQNKIAILYLYQGWATGFEAQHICGERVRKFSTPSGNNMASKSTVN